MAHVYVDVDLDEFSDDEIRDEYKARGLGDGLSLDDETATLTRLRHLMLTGKKDKAHELMYEYVRNKLGTAI